MHAVKTAPEERVAPRENRGLHVCRAMNPATKAAPVAKRAVMDARTTAQNPVRFDGLQNEVDEHDNALTGEHGESQAQV